MDKLLRDKYNENFNQEVFEKFIADINKSSGDRLDFKVCETPLFLTEELTNDLIQAGEEIISSIQTEEFRKNAADAIPKSLEVPNEDDHPVFLQIDFGITIDEQGKFLPQLIELQGFPSLYAYQAFLESKVRTHFEIPNNYSAYFNGLDFYSYKKLFKETLIGDSNPEHVILLEIDPSNQKTRIDFHLTEQYTGVKPICLSDLLKEGNKLFYKKDGINIPIDRIYNRVIFDELMSKAIEMNFSFADELDVTWVGHPNWFYKVSKFSLPQIKSKFNPLCFYLNDLKEYPENIEDYVLKPLFSFAGSGVIIDITQKDLDRIEDRSNYILQRKVNYVPLIQTPEGMSKAEIRMMYIWNEEPLLVNNLLRSSKGQMMGVDFNKNQTWIGSNTIFHPVK